MKAKPFFLYPWLFAAVSGLVYVLAFRSSWTSEDFTTLMLIICTAIGWASIIFIKRGEQHFLLRVYILLSIGFPILYIEVLKITAIDPIWHRITFGLVLLIMVFLNYFISSVLRK